jgi:hypothetical protein
MRGPTVSWQVRTPPHCNMQRSPTPDLTADRIRRGLRGRQNEPDRGTQQARPAAARLHTGGRPSQGCVQCQQSRPAGHRHPPRRRQANRSPPCFAPFSARRGRLAPSPAAARRLPTLRRLPLLSRVAQHALFSQPPQRMFSDRFDPTMPATIGTDQRFKRLTIDGREARAWVLRGKQLAVSARPLRTGRAQRQRAPARSLTAAALPQTPSCPPPWLQRCGAGRRRSPRRGLPRPPLARAAPQPLFPTRGLRAPVRTRTRTPANPSDWCFCVGHRGPGPLQQPDAFLLQGRPGGGVRV